MGRETSKYARTVTLKRVAVLERYGFPSTQYDLWRIKYNRLCGSARKRELACKISFRQYVKLAFQAGITRPKQIGRAPHQLQMARVNDDGDYVWGSCRFITAAENAQEAVINGVRARGGLARRGCTKETHAHVAHVAALKVGKTKWDDAGRRDCADKLGMSFIAFAPNGKRYKGRNVTEFCQTVGAKYGLQQQLLSAVFRGARTHHKGWTGHYTEH